MDLEQRFCAKCRSKFKTLPTSRQIVCSLFCKDAIIYDRNKANGWKEAVKNFYKLKKFTEIKELK